MSKRIRFGRTEVRVAALEDVVIHKIIAGRPRDIEDAASILLKNSDYDAPYIGKWLAEFDAALGEHYLSSFRALIEKLASKQSET